MPSTVSTRSYHPLNSNMPAAILSGSVNLGEISHRILQAIDAGLKLRIAQNISMLPNKDAVIAFATRSDVAFEGGKGLEGKRVSVPGIGSSAEVLFQIWVSRNGGDPKKITAVEMASAQAGDALRAEQIDGAVVVEPFLTRIVQGGIGKIGFRLTDGLPGPVIAISYVGETAWIAKNAPTVAAARAAFLEATEWVKANPAEAACTDHDLSEIAEGGGRHPSAADVSGHDRRRRSEVLARRDEGAGSPALGD